MNVELFYSFYFPSFPVMRNNTAALLVLNVGRICRTRNLGVIFAHNPNQMLREKERNSEFLVFFQ
jgi:uncharacterized membrane protein